jgi:hypothetical protein
MRLGGWRHLIIIVVFVHVSFAIEVGRPLVFVRISILFGLNISRRLRVDGGFQANWEETYVLMAPKDFINISRTELMQLLVVAEYYDSDVD